MADTPHVPPSSFGIVYPEGYLVAVIDDPTHAEQAAAALRAEGIADDAIKLVSGPDAVTYADNLRNRARPGQKMLQQLFMDELSFQQEYDAQVQQGHSLLNVRVENVEHAHQIVALLVPYQAHGVKYYGRWIVTDMEGVS